jgi:carbon monoxide dehydrogenase subunit G
MQQSGEYRIGAPRPRVWDALNDPEVLKACIEGCESLTRTADDAFEAVVKVKVGPLSATFTGEVKLTDLDPPNGYSLNVSAKGGAAGFGRGTARVALAEDGPDTILTYHGEGNVGGKLAQIGQRLIDGAARKTADDFFTTFREIVAPPAAAPAEAASPPTAMAPARRGPVLIWIAVAAALGAGLAALVVWPR